jgi:EmrB/QacA subfamily drug resistance transporter
MADLAIRGGTAQGRWVIAATALASGIVFLDGTAVNVALPAISQDLHGGLSMLQWTADGYLLTLGSLLLMAGSLGDIFGRRRVANAGLVLFTIASVLCGVAPNGGFLIAARALQGVGGTLILPNSLALISSSFAADDRARAIGLWSGLSGVSSAVGPFVAGWLIDASSWRLVFFINVPVAAIALAIANRFVPESRSVEAAPRLDFPGAILASLGLGGIVYALIEGPVAGFTTPSVLTLGLAGLALFGAFLVVERRVRAPMLPMALFRSTQFSGTNVATFLVYAALTAAILFLVVQWQTVMGYSATAAGAALMPTMAILFFFSSGAGRVAQRIGARIPMTVGPLVMAVGFWILSGMGKGTDYMAGVLPGLVLFGFGLAATVAPLTAAVLGAVADAHAGIASGINNAVARVAGLLAIAILPVVAGLRGTIAGPAFTQGFKTIMWITAGLCVAGALVAYATVRRAAVVVTVPHASPDQACEDPCVSVEA